MSDAQVFGEVDALRWRRWMVPASAVALAIGAVLYPDITTALMPLPVACSFLAVFAAAVIGMGRPRYLVALPVVAAFLPSPQIGFAANLLTLAYFTASWGGARLTRRLDGTDYALLAVLLCTLVSWMLNLGSQTDIWSVIVFAITFLSPWLIVFVARAAPWTRQDSAWLAAVMLTLASAQIAPALVKPLVIGIPDAYSVPLLLFDISGVAVLRSLIPGAADVTTGTTVSGHHLGFALLLGLVLLTSLVASGAVRRWMLLWLALAYVFLMTDAKHLVLAAIPAGVAFTHIVLWPGLAPQSRRRARIVGITALITLGGYLGLRVEQFAVSGLWRPYTELGAINPKVKLFSRTAALLSHGNTATWFGFGPGAFGSRAASIRATKVLFKDQNRLPWFIPDRTGEAYGGVAYDLYTSGIFDTEKDRSGALTSPFSSLLGIVAEFGVIGSTAVFGFFFAVTRRGYAAWRDRSADAVTRGAGAALGFAVPLLLVAGLFDTYLEQPDVTAPVALLALIVLAGTTPRDRGIQPGPASGPNLPSIAA